MKKKPFKEGEEVVIRVTTHPFHARILKVSKDEIMIEHIDCGDVERWMPDCISRTPPKRRPRK